MKTLTLFLVAIAAATAVVAAPNTAEAQVMINVPVPKPAHFPGYDPGTGKDEQPARSELAAALAALAQQPADEAAAVAHINAAIADLDSATAADIQVDARVLIPSLGDVLDQSPMSSLDVAGQIAADVNGHPRLAFYLSMVLSYTNMMCPMDPAVVTRLQSEIGDLDASLVESRDVSATLGPAANACGL